MICLNVTRLLFILSCLFFSNSAWAQDEGVKERIVESRKVFICSMSDRDTFKTAEEGCKHWVQKHLPAGYKYSSSTVSENGAVKCICKKSGEADNDQQGMIYGIVICPELAVEYSKNNDNNFNEMVCICPEGYVGNGKICEKDSCGDYKTMGEDGLKEWARATLQRFCNEENEAFMNNPGQATNPKNEPPILTNGEISNWLNWGSKIAANGSQTYSDKIWPMVYGHTIERMVARRVEKDKCLKEYLTYVKNSAQMNENGTNPDFRGKGKLPGTIEYDVTTPEEVINKMNDPKKAHFIFITYTRLLTSDDLAAAAPLPNQPKPPKGNTPPPKTNTPKPPAKKPPKSSTDGR